ncbi:MAG TPA: hypothetical protein VFQ75_03705, partial [Candidatus Limnocylindrales bacterium]|nr:hypothetical protein [Candidatus Limnocylindrales bacterium]
MTDTTSVSTTGRMAPLGPGGELSINLTSSDVRLRAVDGDAVSVRTRGGEPVDDQVLVETAPGRVFIRDAERGFRVGPLSVRGHRSVALEIDVPRTARVSC